MQEFVEICTCSAVLEPISWFQHNDKVLTEKYENIIFNISTKSGNAMPVSAQFMQQRLTLCELSEKINKNDTTSFMRCYHRWRHQVAQNLHKTLHIHTKEGPELQFASNANTAQDQNPLFQMCNNWQDV